MLARTIESDNDRYDTKMHIQFNRLLIIAAPLLLLICLPAVAESNVKSAILAFQKEMNSKPDYVEPKNTDIWVQPSNKEEDCKIETQKEFMEEANAKIFWDGRCFKGFASGIGRQIYYSKSSHKDYITIIHNDDNILRPFMVLGYTEQAFSSGKYDRANKVFEGRFEHYSRQDSSEFEMNVMLGFLDTRTGESAIARKSLSKTETLIYITPDGKIGYYQRQFLTDLSPYTHAIGMMDHSIKKEGGARRFFHIDGTYHDEYYIDTKNYRGASDDSAWQKIVGIINKTQERLEQSLRYYEEARAFGEKYKAEICAKRDTVIKGLPEDATYKLCTWQDDLKKKYDARLEEYTNELELLKQAYKKKMEAKESDEGADS